MEINEEKMSSYKKLETVFEKIGNLEDAKAMLSWDAGVMMPKKSATARGRQMAAIESIVHSLLTDPKIQDFMEESKTDDSLNDWEKANLHEIERTWRHTIAVPADLQEQFTMAGSACEMVWRDTRPQSDFKTFAPYLQKVIDITREIAKIKAKALNCSPYDALIDQFDPGTTCKQIDAVFTELKSFLPSLREKTMAKQKPVISLAGEYPIEKQKELGLDCLKAVNFDFDAGRFDVSLHPFCGGIPEDIRITTRYNTNDFTSALMGVMHESGHAQYERKLPAEWLLQPVGKARGMAMHESQSLLIEMQVSRSKEFLEFIQPKLQSILGLSAEKANIENLLATYRTVKPDFIRVEADEITYPSHIMLRYDLEKAFISGELSVADLPEAWNELMQKYLGIIPDNHSNGCMQDIHWPWGAFGYFPSYTLGAIIAAQLFAKIRKDLPSVLENIRQGNFVPLQSWLEKNIHSLGSKYSTQDLLKRATGKELDVSDYKTHLETRYT